MKLVMQALKPINTLVYGMQDLERQLLSRGEDESSSATAAAPSSSSSSRAPPPGVARVRELRFSNLKAVHVGEGGLMLQLEDLQGDLIAVPLFAAPLNEASHAALADGFRSALAPPGGLARWAPLGAALRGGGRFGSDSAGSSLELRGVSSRVGAGSDASAGASRSSKVASGQAGQRTLEVWEVERRMPSSAAWKTPWLPTDRERGWRWVDASGLRHPSLAPGLGREAAARERRPPCRLDTLFRCTSEWLVRTGPGTDQDGWCYGLAWNASGWESTPGRLATIRKRKWARAYE